VHECAFCGSSRVTLVTTTLEEQQGDVVVRIEGVPAIQCHDCQDGREPAVTLGFAKAAEVAYDLVFAAAAASRDILTSVASEEPAR
jgi:YgiT-type zinc finger domain-containing protein